MLALAPRPDPMQIREEYDQMSDAEFNRRNSVAADRLLDDLEMIQNEPGDHWDGLQ
jgi:hypothetical protein